MKTLLILFSFLLLTTPDIVHKDTPLQIDSNGNIIGLPNNFSPAKFDKTEKILRIRNRILLFPECISKYFEENKNPKLNLSASWYHSKDVLPYYLNFEISGKKANYGYSILVDLETLELISVHKKTLEGNTINNQKIELGESCLNEYQNGIRITY